MDFAIDRDRVVALGGRTRGRPTQLPDPAGRRSRATSPLPLHREAGGGSEAGLRLTWSAPAAWWRPPGEPESASSFTPRPGAPPSARYYVRVLDDLGFRATLAIEGRRWLPQRCAPRRASSAGSRAALTPSTFLADNFACDAAGAGESNVSRLCDRELDRLIDRAERTPPAEALSAWAAADRRVTAIAAAVPLTSRRVAILVSKRVGNVKTHCQWYTLLDQMWVR